MVLTRVEFADIYLGNPFISRFFYASFPICLHQFRFSLKDALGLVLQLVRLRLLGFDLVVSDTGDFRETLLGWLISPRGNAGITWPRGHPARKLVRAGLGRLLRQRVEIELTEKRRYDAVAALARALGASQPLGPKLYDVEGAAWTHRPSGRVVTVHPFASQACKEWPITNWRDLIEGLCLRGFEVVAVCPPSQRRALEGHLAPLARLSARIEAGSFQHLCRVMSQAAIAVTSDSLAAHVATAIGQPCIVLNGANETEVILPPGAVGLEPSIKPDCHPCFVHPHCAGGPEPYACIARIEVAEVLTAVQRISPVRTGTISDGTRPIESGSVKRVDAVAPEIG